MKLENEERQVLERLLNIIVVKGRTGEIGIMHGADRFVSSQTIFKKTDLDKFESVIRKLGINPKIKKV